MPEIEVLVEPGFRVIADNGQHLEVTDRCAVGCGGKLFHTAIWAEDRSRLATAWAQRSWLRKFLGLPPSDSSSGRVAPVFGSDLSSLLGRSLLGS